MKKIFMLLLAALFTMNANAQKMEKITYSGPFTAVSYPLIIMADRNSLGDFAEKSEFRYWQNPDQLRALIAGRQADFLAVPSYVGAAFHNKGIPVKLMNISVWGILHVVSIDSSVKTFADLKGKKIVVPFRGEMPDIIFRNLAQANGVDLDRDCELHYVAHPMDVAQLLLSGRADHAMTAEPAATMSIRKSIEMNKAGKAEIQHKVINLQTEWGRIHNTAPRIAQAGTLALPSVTSRKELLEKFEEEFEKSVTWILENPEEAAEIIAGYLPQMKKPMIIAGIRNSDLKAVTAKDAEADTMKFFRVLHSFAPEKIGGKMPGTELFYEN